MTMTSSATRRHVLRTGAVLTAGLACPLILPARTFAQPAGTQTINMQLGWLANNNQLGEIVAKRLGYFEEERINFTIQPGGPSIDGVAIVASGRYEIGQVSSSPSLLLAASQGIPVKCFAVGAQQHPYSFFSLPAKPIKSPQDMVGKKVGIQATGRVLLSALLRKHKIAESDVKVVVIGADMSPLLTGQVDCVTGWETNRTALKPLGPDMVTMRLWDHGVRLYAMPYYATAKTLETKGPLLAGFLRAAGRGWQYAHDNLEKAVDLFMKEYPDLVREDELTASKILLNYIFTDKTRENGWGCFDAAVWQEQIDLYAALSQFSAGPPAVTTVMTTALLDATRDKRPKIG
ncbi:MAG TPA: ABC transporter substrate-binding protein [Vineibacter sp.]|nr:ABC transporter substrate-binding protein [Vineibacter sp.]